MKKIKIMLVVGALMGSANALGMEAETSCKPSKADSTVAGFAVPAVPAAKKQLTVTISESEHNTSGGNTPIVMGVSPKEWQVEWRHEALRSLAKLKFCDYVSGAVPRSGQDTKIKKIFDEYDRKMLGLKSPSK